MPVEFADPVELLINFYTARLDDPVIPAVTNPRPDRFVTVSRSGGGAVNRVMDQPLMTIQGWAQSAADSQSLAQECRTYLLNEPTAIPLLRSVEELSFYEDPDPASQQPRHTLSVSLRLRGHRT